MEISVEKKVHAQLFSGVGLARGIEALDLSKTRDIFVSWTITMPAGAGLSIAFFFILKAIFT